MTRYSEMYRTEVEAHERTTRNLIIVREQLGYVSQFIRENGLSGKFAEWATEKLKTPEHS